MNAPQEKGREMTPTAPRTVTSSELLSVVASRELASRRTVFAGIGLPTLAT